jgi:hypothetical protein
MEICFITTTFEVYHSLDRFITEDSDILWHLVESSISYFCTRELHDGLRTGETKFFTSDDSEELEFINIIDASYDSDDRFSFFCLEDKSFGCTMSRNSEKFFEFFDTDDSRSVDFLDRFHFLRFIYVW